MRVPFVAASIGAIALLAAGCSASGRTTSTHTSVSSGAVSSGVSPTTSAASVSPQQALLLASKAEQSDTSITATVAAVGTVNNGNDVSGTLEEQIRPSYLAELDFTSVTSGGQSTPGGYSEIITPEAVYARIPGLLQSMHVTKPWAEFKFSQLGASVSSLQPVIAQVQAASPATLTTEVATSTDARKAGTGVVDGVPVTEYAGSYSLSQAMSALPASERATVGDSLSGSGFTSFKFEIWIDSGNQPRRFVIVEDGTAGNLTNTMTITSYNQQVSIDLPTAAETYVVPASKIGASG
jgi:hypothetical protein